MDEVLEKYSQREPKSWKTLTLKKQRKTMFYYKLNLLKRKAECGTAKLLECILLTLFQSRNIDLLITTA